MGGGFGGPCCGAGHHGRPMCSRARRNARARACNIWQFRKLLHVVDQFRGAWRRRADSGAAPMAGPAVMKVEITRDDALSKSIHCSTVESERTAASELGSRAFSRVAHARAIRESTHSPISTETRPTSHHDGQLPKWQRDEHFTSSPRSSQPWPKPKKAGGCGSLIEQRQTFR